jgi:hypothetical protein
VDSLKIRAGRFEAWAHNRTLCVLGREHQNIATAATGSRRLVASPKGLAETRIAHEQRQHGDRHTPRLEPLDAL